MTAAELSAGVDSTRKKTAGNACCLELVRPERFELPTTWFVARYSIQLSYGRSYDLIVLTAEGTAHGVVPTGAPGEIRTPDHLVRSQVLYPTELRARRQERNYADMQGMRQRFGENF